MRLASRSVERRCAMRIVVRPDHQPAEGCVDLLLHAAVDRGRGVVEEEDLRIGEQGAGERDPLALAPGEQGALLADDGVVAVRQGADEVVRLGRAGGRLDLLVGRVRAAEGDVGTDGVGEQEGVLEDDADLAAQAVERHVAHVDAFEANVPGLDVVEAREQQPDRRLPRARRADNPDRLARGDLQGEVARGSARTAGSRRRPRRS